MLLKPPQKMPQLPQPAILQSGFRLPYRTYRGLIGNKGMLRVYNIQGLYSLIPKKPSEQQDHKRYDPKPCLAFGAALCLASQVGC